MCTFSFGLNFRRDSRFKRYPSWQYWNKCQNIIRIYWTKQFERKTQINRIFFFPLCFVLRHQRQTKKKRVWCLSLQLKHKQNKKKWCCRFILGLCALMVKWLNFQFTRNFHKTTKKCLFSLVSRLSFFLLCLLVSLKMCICNKCVWLSLFSLIRRVIFFFYLVSSIHIIIEANVIERKLLRIHSVLHIQTMRFYHGNEHNDGLIQFYNYVISQWAVSLEATFFMHNDCVWVWIVCASI